MIAYNDTFKNFKKHISENKIVDEVMNRLRIKVGDSERRSIRNSTGEMYKVLNQADFHDDIRIGIEYKIPITARRIDFIISGSDGVNDNLIIIELKQWDKVSKTDMPNVIKLGNQEHVHPSWQAYSYAATITHFNEAIEVNKIRVMPLAFLHNYKQIFYNQIADDIYKEALELAPVFIESDYLKLRSFIDKYIKYPSKKDLLFEIETGKIKPSKMLVDALGKMLNNNEEFTLLDEQKVVMENLYKIATDKSNNNNKKVVIVEGGAGTGKSVIAIDLLSKLISKKAMTCFYVAKSSYVKENYLKQLTKDVPQYRFLKTLFKGSGSFIDSHANEFDCLIVDEAHRLTEKTKRSFMFYGENQIKEIINASKVSIFFIDPKQSVDIKDFGTIQEIKKWANHFNTDIYHSSNLKLKSQFRCNGSDEYLSWVESILYNEKYEQSDKLIDYDIKIFDDLIEMKKAIGEKNINNKARMISGDVFPWISRADKTLIDINIGDFHAQWNKTATFATDIKSIDEVGCIHTTQGMEFEYVGLIIGDDLLYRNNKIITDYTKHPDGANEFKRPHQRRVFEEDKEIVDQLIRNTYRVLFTRGQKGCYIYCMDKDLSNYIKSEISKLNIGRVDIDE